MSAPAVKPINQIHYPVYCAWCRNIVGHTSVEHSTGICPDCLQMMRAQVRALRSTKTAQHRSVMEKNDQQPPTDQQSR